MKFLISLFLLLISTKLNANDSSQDIPITVVSFSSFCEPVPIYYPDALTYEEFVDIGEGYECATSKIIYDNYIDCKNSCW